MQEKGEVNLFWLEMRTLPAQQLIPSDLDLA